MQGKKAPVWKTKDGQRIPMTEMTDAHIRNAIANLERGVVEKRQQLIDELEEKIADFEANLENVRARIRLEAQTDYHELGFIDSGLAAALALVYDARWEEHLNRLEQLKNRLELIKAGDPRGVNGYQELIRERNRRQGV
jgi:predicted nucleic acid-binding protein